MVMHRDKARNQGNDQEYRIDAPDQERSPETRKDSRKKTVILAEQNRKDQRRKCIQDEQGRQLEIDISSRDLREDDLDRRQLHEQDPKNQGNPRVAPEAFSVG
jgi:hypothetical protein